MVTEVRHDIILKNPISEWLPDTIEGKQTNDGARDYRGTCEEDRNATREISRAEVRVATPKENEKKRATDQDRKQEQDTLHRNTETKSKKEAGRERTAERDCTVEEHDEREQPERRPEIVRPKFHRAKV